MLKALLTHPLTRGLDIDSPETTNLRRRIVAEKKFLRRVYEEWYQNLANHIPKDGGKVIEIGSGAGFMKNFLPDLITSDILPLEGIDLVLNGADLPFEDGALRGLVMTNVLHHIPNTPQFFREAGRCMRVGGRMAFLEPWVSGWSKKIYTKLHHEPFETEAPTWEFPEGGPLSTANGALPWIIFGRDRARFEREFPEWRVSLIQPSMPFRYLMSGGVSMRSLMPNWAFGFWKWVEEKAIRKKERWAMFAYIVVERVAPPAVPLAA